VFTEFNGEILLLRIQNTPHSVVNGAHAFNCEGICHDLDLGPMTLKMNRDLHIPKIYHHTKNKVAR